MRLLVISHTAHHRAKGTVVGWGPTVREIDQLTNLFEEIVHVAPLHAGEPPATAIPYASGRVRLVPVRPSGGNRWIEKLGVLAAAFGYLRTIRRELDRAEAVHVRCPAAISLIAVLLLARARRPERRWIKYAGTWSPRGREPWSYALQRRLLAGTAHGAIVTVNGRWAGQPGHVRSFTNPCLTDEELREGERAAWGKRLESPLRLLFVGRLTEGKGAGRVMEIARLLGERGIASRITLVGDGPLERGVERQASRLPAGSSARMTGPLPRPALSPFYAESHFLILPSRSEGWPKVIGEAMAYGAVPVTSDAGAIPSTLAGLRVGRALPADDVVAFVEAIAEYASDPSRWKMESQRAVASAPAFGYSRYLDSVRDLLGLASEFREVRNG